MEDQLELVGLALGVVFSTSSAIDGAGERRIILLSGN